MATMQFPPPVHRHPRHGTRVAPRHSREPPPVVCQALPLLGANTVTRIATGPRARSSDSWNLRAALLASVIVVAVVGFVILDATGPLNATVTVTPLRPIPLMRPTRAVVLPPRPTKTEHTLASNLPAEVGSAVESDELTELTEPRQANLEDNMLGQSDTPGPTSAWAARPPAPPRASMDPEQRDPDDPRDFDIPACPPGFGPASLKTLNRCNE
jgi:hypothetical protein